MLGGLRVLDLTDPDGWLAGRILADLGADVVLAEPTGGHPARATDPEAFAAYNAGKRSAIADAGALVAAADVVIECGLTDRYERIARERTVWCAITPFGRTGPKAPRRASDLSVVASSGNMWMTGDPDRPPLRCTFPTSWYHGCADAAAGILAALLHRDETGRGQLVDVSLQEAYLLANMSRVSQYGLGGARGRRAGALMRVGETTQREIWRCKDGYVSFGLRSGPARIPGLKALVAWIAESGMATPALTGREWDSYNHNLLTQDEVDAISEPIAAFFVTRTMTELYDAALERGMMLAPANTAAEILASPQAAARAFLTEVDDPALGPVPLPRSFVSCDAVPGVRRPAPRPGEHTEEVLRAWAPSTT